MFSKPKIWFTNFDGGKSKSKSVHSLENLKYLHGVLMKNQTVNDQNCSLLVETLRSISEILIWGDQNDSTVFDFFLEKNMLVFFLKFIKQRGGASICVQLLQTLNILFENISDETSVYYLLSNNHVNSIIVHEFDFSDEEVMAYYISFLKTLSMKLNKHTVHFFYNEHTNDFALYTEALKFFNHSESMVRIAVRTITLNVYRACLLLTKTDNDQVKADNKDMLGYINEKTGASYFVHLISFVASQIVDLHECIRKDTDHRNREKIEYLTAEHLDHLHYLNDILCLNIDLLNQALVSRLFESLFEPLYIRPLLTPHKDVNFGEEQVVSIFLLSQVYLTLHYDPIIIRLTHILFGTTLLPEITTDDKKDTRKYDQTGISAVKETNSTDEEKLLRSQSGSCLCPKLFHNRAYLSVLHSSLDCSQGDHLTLVGLCLFYAIEISQEGIELAHSLTSSDIECQSVGGYDGMMVDGLLSILSQACVHDSKVRLATLDLAILLLKKMMERKEEKNRKNKNEVEIKESNEIGKNGVVGGVGVVKVGNAVKDGKEIGGGVEGGVAGVDVDVGGVNGGSISGVNVEDKAEIDGETVDSSKVNDTASESNKCDGGVAVGSDVKCDGGVVGGSDIKYDGGGVVGASNDTKNGGGVVGGVNEVLASEKGNLDRTKNGFNGVNGESRGTDGVNGESRGTDGVKGGSRGTDGVNGESRGTDGVNGGSRGTDGVNGESRGADGVNGGSRGTDVVKGGRGGPDVINGGMQDKEMKCVETIMTEATLLLRYYFEVWQKSEEVFLDMFEDEYRELKGSPLRVEFLTMEASVVLPPISTPLTGIHFCNRLPCGEVERARKAIRAFFLMRCFHNHLRHHTDTCLPLTKLSDCVQPGDVLDLNNSDLIACTVIHPNKKEKRFLVIDIMQLILVEPDSKKLGWGLVKFVAFLQDTEVAGDKDDSRCLQVTIHKASTRAFSKSAPSFASKFLFDDHIRCMAARQRLTKGRLKARQRKMHMISKLVCSPSTQAILPSFNRFSPSLPGRLQRMKHDVEDPKPFFRTTPSPSTSNDQLLPGFMLMANQQETDKTSRKLKVKVESSGSKGGEKEEWSSSVGKKRKFLSMAKEVKKQRSQRAHSEAIEMPVVREAKRKTDSVMQVNKRLERLYLTPPLTKQPNAMPPLPSAGHK